jgi:hypothetical protein
MTVSAQRKLLNKKTLIIAASLSGIASAAYACPVGHSLSYSFCRQVSLAGFPGILIAAAISIALLGGSHGGGPLGILLFIATPINFFLYVGLGIAVRKLAKLFRKPDDKST